MTARKILARLAAVTIEEEATFETDPASSPTRLRNVRNVEAMIGAEMIPVDYQKSSDMRGPDGHVRAGKSGSVSFEIPLFTTDGSVAQALTAMKRMGMELFSVADGSTVITGGSANTIELSDGDAATSGIDNAEANIGKAVHHKPASGTSSIRGIERIQDAAGTTTVTANQDFATTPQAGDSIVAMDAVKPKGGDPDKTFAVTVYFGHGSTNRLKLVCTGCAGKWELTTVGPKNLPVIKFDFQVSQWVDSEANISQPDATGNRPMTMLGAKLYIDGTEVKTRNFGFNPNISLDEIESLDTNGRQGWTHDWEDPVLEYQPLHDTDYIGAFEAETKYDIMLERIAADTQAFFFWAPSVQVVGYELEEQGRLLHAKKSLLVCDPGLNADNYELPPYVFAMGQ